MRRPLTVQPPFKTLVSNLKGGSDPSKGASGNPQKSRIGFNQSNIVGARLHSGIKVTNGAEIDVADSLTYDLTIKVVEGGGYSVPNNLEGDSVFLGDVEIKEGLHYNGTAGNDNTTATSLATAINRINGYRATADNNIVYVAGSFGTDRPNQYEAKIITRIGAANFTVSNDDSVYSNRTFALSRGTYNGAGTDAVSHLNNIRGPEIIT